MELISGGVCAPKGFSAGGVHAGIRKNKDKKDLAVIISDTVCSAAGVYTTNLVKGAPILVTRQNLSDGKAQAIICNSGNANTCNADGIEISEKMCELTAKTFGINKKDIIVASTGVIGQPLDIKPIENAMPILKESVGNNSQTANEAIMTTDTVKKDIAVSFFVGGKECRIGGIAKGSGMIHPNMATMLVFLTTDINISSDLLYKAIKDDIKDTFNMTSIDGDTSTNDMLTIMANGKAGNSLISDENSSDYTGFKEALGFVTRDLCRKIAKDGEGATKLLTCKVYGAKDKENAKIIAKSVITSSLFKAAMFGADANWGRVLCAIGYSGANVDINKIDVDFISAAGAVSVCKNGAGIPFDELYAKKVLSEDEIDIVINSNQGEGFAEAWGCDLTYDYVKINGDYRT